MEAQTPAPQQETDKRLLIIAAFVVALAIALIVGLTGGDDDSSSSSVADTSDLTKPEVEVPSGDPPAELQVTDITEGEGDVAAQGDQVSVQYVGVLFDGGEEFDSSWSRNEPFEFTLGTGAVIPGWDQGVDGMKVGGRRQLVIPPDLAYGEQGQPPDIPPSSTLVFVIDLLSVGPAAQP